MSTGTTSTPIASVESPQPVPGGPYPTAPEEVLTSADFRYRFRIEDLDRLDRLGFFDDDDTRFELLDGDLIPMARVLPPHASTVNRLTRLFTKGFGDRASVVIQNPIVLGERTEPQPDLTLARFREDGYERAHPRPDDVFVVIEVMDSTHRKDRGVKLPLYARAGLPEAWMIDVPGGKLEVHRKPIDGIYTENLILGRGQSVSPELFLDVVLTVDSILSRPES